MSDFLIFKAAFNNSATPAIGTYTAEGATAQFNNDPDVSLDYYLYNTADDTAVQWFVPTAETTDFEFVADILTRQWTDRVTYFIIADSTGTTRLRMWSQNDNWHFENSDSIATTGDPEYVGAIDPATSGGFGVFHRFRVRVRKLTASSSSVEVYVDGALKLTATAGAALVTCAKIGFVGGVNTYGPGVGAGVKNAYVYDLSGGDVIDRGVLSGAFSRFISWAKSIFATQDNVVLRSGGSLMTGSRLGRVDDTGVFQVCGGQTGADGGSISLTGKNRGVSDGAVELTAYDGVDSTGVQILPDGTMTVTYPDTTVKNVAMAEDVVPRSGGAVITGNTLARNADGGYLNLCASTRPLVGPTISLYGADGAIQILPSLNDNYTEMKLQYSGTLTWSGQPIQYVSDQRLKQQIAEIDDKLLDAWESVELCQFKYNDAVNEKGKDNARLHTGYVVQQIDKACKEHGVDISNYGLFCHEEYAEETEEVEVTQKDGTKTKERKVIREANEHYSLRYTEALIVECKYLRRCIERLEVRLAQFENPEESQEKGTDK